MPSTTALVAGLTLPLPAGAANSRVADVTVDGLLDYLAYWLSFTLDTKFANLTGTSATAIPTANRFAYDPRGARAEHVHLRPPCLYVWWNGRSVRKEATTIYHHRIRTIQALYIFQELPAVATWEKRDAIFNAVDATFFRAAQRGRHPLYGYGSDPDGKPIWSSLNLRAFDYLGGERGRFGIDGADGVSRQGGTAVQGAGQDFPAFFASFNVEERIEADPAQDPSDIAGDYNVVITTNEQGDENNMVEILNGYAPGPDGSEQDEE